MREVHPCFPENLVLDSHGLEPLEDVFCFSAYQGRKITGVSQELCNYTEIVYIDMNIQRENTKPKIILASVVYSVVLTAQEF